MGRCLSGESQARHFEPSLLQKTSKMLDFCSYALKLMQSYAQASATDRIALRGKITSLTKHSDSHATPSDPK